MEPGMRRRFTNEIPLGVEEGIASSWETPWMTYLIIALNALVYLFTAAPTGLLETSDYWAARLGFYPGSLVSNPAKALVSILLAMFTHANLLHIIFNMYYLYLFGRAVERSLGHWRYLALYILSGYAAAIFHSVFTITLSTQGIAVPSIGASGAISGILGAYMLLYPGTRLAACFFLLFFPVCFELTAVYYLLFWFAMQVYMGYLLSASSTVAFFAHAGGFVAGIALLPLVADRTRLSIIRMQAAARRLWGLIIFYVPYLRRELSPPVKATLAMLISMLLVGTVYTTALSYTDRSTILAGYNIDAIIGGTERAYGVFYVLLPKTPPGKIIPGSVTYSYVLLGITKLLADNNLLYNPNLAGETIETSSGRAIVKVPGSPGRTALLEIKSFRGIYDRNGLLVKGYMNVRVTLYMLVTRAASAEVTAEIWREGLGYAWSFTWYSMVALALLLGSLYTVLRLDRELVITPE